MKKRIQWLMPVLTCLIVSILSLFLPVLTYLYPNGKKTSFNILSFIQKSDEFVQILYSYNGPFQIKVGTVWLVILAVLAALAIVAAFVGVVTMSRQRPNKGSFVLSLVGIIGTAIPSIIVMIAAPVSRQYLPGFFQVGVYPIITPIAMALCIVTVTRKHKKTQAEIQAAEKAKGLLRPGGDL